MNNLNELNSLADGIEHLNSQIKAVNRNPIKEDIIKTYKKGEAIIEECKKFISEHLDLFRGTYLCNTYDNVGRSGDVQFWFNGGLVFIANVETKIVYRCWKMEHTDSQEQGYFGHEVPCFSDWYNYGKSSFVEVVEKEIQGADDGKLLKIKYEVDGFYKECESLFGLIADALKKTKEAKENHLAKLNSALDEGANKKEVLYKIEITKVEG